MVAIKKGDFIKLEYTGMVDDGTIFDTTRKAVAVKAGLNPKAKYEPIIICVGEGQLLPGLDAFLEGKPYGKHTCELPSTKAFGKKEMKLLKLIPQNKFKESQLRPAPGLQVNVDGHYGVVRSVSGGRVTVDFNHPLAGRDVRYELDVLEVVTDPAVQVTALLDMAGFHHHGVTMEGADHVVIAVHDQPPAPLAESLNGMITKLTSVQTVSYHAESGKEDH